MQHYTELLNHLPELELPFIKGNKKIEYANIEAGFDIETTSTKINGEKTAFMYVWMIGIGLGSPIYYGTTWDEFYHLCEALQQHFDLHEERLLPIYVHNLGYEFQFFSTYFEWTNVFSLSERKPLRAVCSLGIEFRDSYNLSGMSLANTARNLTKYKVKKMEGDLDYSLVRTPKTPLTEPEIQYCINDIEIILAYIKEQIEQNGNNITRLPMTKTGRVRKYVRDNCYYKNIDGTKGTKGQYMRYRKIMEDLTMDVPTYLQLKRSFMGGFTHANANYVGAKLSDVTSIDFTSSYPSVMVSERFPMTRFHPVQVKNIEHFEKLCATHAVIFDAQFENITPALAQENYLSESKCASLSNPVINNGRVVSADLLQTTLTEVDYTIMKQSYEWEELSLANVKVARKDYLPKPIIESIMKLYQDKTELKGVVGSEVEYNLSKEMLNSIYGMCVTDPVKPLTTYENHNWDVTQPDLEEALQNHNESKNRFLYYPWGIWTTAYARRNLWTGIAAVGNDYVYSDTDSLKILNYERHKPYVEWFDKQIVNKMIAMCKHYGIDQSLLNPKTVKGEEKILGIWDYEGTYPRFKTLGAKRYLVEDRGELVLTVSGLSKRNGIEYMKEVCGNDFDKVFDLFNDELYIPADKTGKMTHTYIDEEMSYEIEDYLGNKDMIKTMSGIHLESCEFTLSLSSTFIDFLSNLKDGKIYRGLRLA